MSEDKRLQIIGLIRDTIHAVEPTAEIILYGSRARGDAREDSDWDVLAIIDKPRLSLKDRTHIQYPIWDKGLELGQEINVFPYTRRQWEQAPLSLFKFNVLQEGIVI
jgi:predicted nucleotidyltransferase